MCDGMFHTAAELVLGNHGNLALSSFHCLPGSLINACALQCGNFHDLAAQFLCQLVNADLVAVLADNVHHVDGDNYRNAKLHQLCGEVQVTFQIGAVDDVQDGVGLLLDQIGTGDDLFQGVGRQRIDTGQVLNDDVFLALQLAFLLLDSDTGPVADVLVGAGQIVEQGRFATVRVAGQCDLNAHCVPFLSVRIKPLRSFQRRPCAHSVRSCARSVPWGHPEVPPCGHRSRPPW